MLTGNCFSVSVVNTPKEAGLGCSISVKFEQRLLPNVKIMIASKPFRSFSGIYVIRSNGMRNSYEKIG